MAKNPSRAIYSIRAIESLRVLARQLAKGKILELHMEKVLEEKEKAQKVHEDRERERGESIIDEHINDGVEDNKVIIFTFLYLYLV